MLCELSQPLHCCVQHRHASDLGAIREAHNAVVDGFFSEEEVEALLVEAKAPDTVWESIFNDNAPLATRPPDGDQRLSEQDGKDCSSLGIRGFVASAFQPEAPHYHPCNSFLVSCSTPWRGCNALGFPLKTATRQLVGN